MKEKIFSLLLFILGFNLLLAGRDTTANISDGKKAYRNRINDKCNEYLNETLAKIYVEFK
jgi:hypothetical protein